jgi:CheY-like chemotaxis protein
LRKRVLLVEDHADTAFALAKYLELSGFSVSLAQSVNQALQLLESTPFDLVLSDIGLPDASGCDLMLQVEKRWHLKGIAMSGYGTKQDIQRSLASGFSEHIVKPLKMPHVIDSLHRLLEETPSE